MDAEPIATINYKDMDFFWITDYFDLPLLGYCRYNGELCLFDAADDYFAKTLDLVYYNIHSLTLLEKIQMLMNKKIFETCVSTHWSYPRKPEPATKPEWLKKLLHNFYFWVK